MEDIKEQITNSTKDKGFLATVAAVAVGLAAKRFTNDAIGSIGAALVTYATVKRI